jgi:hypothetical protein
MATSAAGAGQKSAMCLENLRSDHGADLTLGCWRVLVVCAFITACKKSFLFISILPVQKLKSQLTGSRVSILVGDCV